MRLGWGSTSPQHGREKDMTIRFKALLAVLLLVPAPSIGVLAGMYWWPDSALGQGLWMASKVWLLALPVLWHRLVDGEAWSWSPARRGGWAWALFSGLAIAAAIIGGYLLVRPCLDQTALVDQLTAVGLADRWLLLGLGLYWCTVNAMLEEYVWRWFLVSRAERILTIGAVPFAAACFTLHHVFALACYFSGPFLVLTSFGVFCGGVVWSWLYARYRSIWPAWLSHAWADIAIVGVAWTWL